MYNQAIPHLESAARQARNKNHKTRINYILAQTYEETGNTQNAYKTYKKVVSLNPPYDMSFNARINQAESFDVNTENVSDIKKTLRKMLRDEKNKEYQDQIYYAYGQISLKEENLEEAIDFFKRSAAVSVSNSKQKALSYLSIADLYFDDNRYSPSQAYYDSAVRLLTNDYPGYDLISSKSRSLNRLVTNLNTIEREDSLQMVAAMDVNARNAFIDEMIRSAREEEQRARESQSLGSYSPSSFYESDRQIRQELNRSGKWYFYNPTVVSFGRTEFKNRWGERTLEDHWRRANKSISEMNINQIIEGEQGFQDSVPEVTSTDKYSREFYMKDLPLTDDLIKISNSKIEEALYQAAVVYFEELKDYAKSKEAFELLNTRFPQTTHLLSSYYYLYDIASKTGETGMMQVYKNKIISDFPESEYAQMLSDPDYMRKKNEEEMVVYRLYESLYNQYLAENYSQVVSGCEKAMEEHSGHDIVPKFQLLRAYAIAGMSNDTRQFKSALEEIVESAPDGPEKQRAMDLIAYFRDENPDIRIEDEQKESLEIYSYDPDEDHLVVIHTSNLGMDLNQVIFNIINHNLDNYPQSEFATEKEDWDQTSSLVIIRGTGTGIEASDYLEKLINDASVKQELDKANYRSFIISASNFMLLKEHLSIPVYLRFYEKHYLSDQGN